MQPTPCDWLLGTLFVAGKEFIAVFFQLICFSRLGLFDFFTGPLVLYVTLIVFNFPFLNSYLFACLRLSVWNRLSTDVRLPIAQIAVVLIFQCSAALCAAAMTKPAKDRWSNRTAVWSSNVDATADVQYNDVREREPQDYALVFAEEFVAVMALLVGLVHLMEADKVVSKLLERWKAASEAPEAEDASDASKRPTSGQPTFPPNARGNDDDVDQIPTSSLDVGSSCDFGPTAGAPFNFIRSDASTKTNAANVNPGNRLPVPSAYILQVCLLVAGLTRAFPSAHQSLHVSIYVIMLRKGDDYINSTRIAGGVAATVLATVYCYVAYRWSSDGGRERGATAQNDHRISKRLMHYHRNPPYLFSPLSISASDLPRRR